MAYVISVTHTDHYLEVIDNMESRVTVWEVQPNDETWPNVRRLRDIIPADYFITCHYTLE